MASRSLIDVVEASIVVPRGIEGFWSIICDLDQLGEPWTINDVVNRTNVDRRNVSDYVQGLRGAGYVTVVATLPAARKGVSGANCFRLAKRPAVAPRVKRDGTEYPETHLETLWRTMKMVKVFSVSELAAQASSEERPVKFTTTQAYLLDLLAVGIIREVRSRKGDQPARYQLVRNMGSRAPKILKPHIVFDPNTNTVIGRAEAREVTP